MPSRSDTIMGGVTAIQIHGITAKIDIVPSTAHVSYMVTVPNASQLRGVSINPKPDGTLQVTSRQNDQRELREFTLQATVGKRGGDTSDYRLSSITINITISAPPGTSVRAKMRGVLNVS